METDDNVICASCGQRGHIARQCAQNASYGGVYVPPLFVNDVEYLKRALELHPNSSTYFNLAPTIAMLKIADQYGFEITRKAPPKPDDRLSPREIARHG